MPSQGVGAYDFMLTIDGVDVGFMLFEQEGTKQWYEGLVEKLTPQQRTSSFSYEHVPPDIDVPVSCEDLSFGAGFFEVDTSVEGATQRYNYSQGIDLSWPGMMLRSPARDELLTAASVAPLEVEETTVSWSGGPVGAAESIDLTLPTNVLEITDGSTQAAQVIAALQAGDYRIWCSGNQTVNLGSSQITLGAGPIQIFSEDGTLTLDGTAIDNACMFLQQVSNVFFGNVDFLMSAGQDDTVSGGNNPAGVIEFTTSGADNLYMLHCQFTSPDVTAEFGSPNDAPEGINVWNNGPAEADSPNNITVHGLNVTRGVGDTKSIIAGGSQPASAFLITAYRSVFDTHQRSPRLDDAAQGDWVNSVWVTNGDRIHGAAVADNAIFGARGCAIGKTSDSTPGRKEIEDAGTGNTIYAPTSGAGTDNNLLVTGTQGTPAIDTTTSSAPSLPYTLTPAEMTTTLMNTIIAEAGPGNIVISHQLSVGGAVSPTSESVADTPFKFVKTRDLGVWCLAGPYLYEIDNNNQELVLRFTGSVDLTDLVEFSGRLYVAQGTGTNYYSSADKVAWTEYTADAAVEATLFAVRSDVLFNLEQRDLRTHTDPTTGGWSAADSVGNSSETFRSLVSTDGQIFLFSDRAIYSFLTSTADEIYSTLSKNTSNGKGAFLWDDGNIYVPYNDRLLQFDPLGDTSFNPVYPLPEHRANSEMVGTITAIGGDTQWLYVAVKNPVGNTYIMKGNPYTGAWHTWLYLGANDCLALLYCEAGSVHSTNPVLLFGYGDTVQMTILPRVGFRPDTDGFCKFTAGTGFVVLPWWNFGAASFNKFLNEGRVLGSIMSASNYASLAYELDESGSFTTLLTAIDDGLSAGSPDTVVSFNRIRAKVTLANGSPYTTPRVIGFTLHATPNPPRRRQWNLTFVMDNGLILNDGQRDTQDVAWVRGLLAGAAEKRLTLRVRDGTDITVHMRDMQGQGIKAVSMGGEERDVELRNIVLAEIRPLTTGATNAIYGESAYGDGRVYS